MPHSQRKQPARTARASAGYSPSASVVRAVRATVPALRRAVVFAALYAAYAACALGRRLDYRTLIRTGAATTASAGALGSAFEVAGGIGRVLGGSVADALPAEGLLLTCVVAVGFSQLSFPYLGSGHFRLVVWAAHGVAQALAWPALSRVFMSTFTNPVGRGTLYSLMSTSMNLGAAAAPLIWARYAGENAELAAPLARFYAVGGAVLAIATASAAALAVTRSEQTSIARAGVGVEAAPATQRSGNSGAMAGGRPASLPTVLRTVARDAPLRSLAVAYLFNSAARSGLVDWATVVLEALPSAVAANCIAAFEFGGACGGFAAGAVSDRCFNGRRGPVMAVAAAALAPLPLVIAVAAAAASGPGNDSGWMTSGALAAAVLPLLYGIAGALAASSHVLNGLASIELAPPGMSTAVAGITKAAGQAGGALSGSPLGTLAAALGWPSAMVALSICAALSSAASATLWSAEPPSRLAKKEL